MFKNLVIPSWVKPALLILAGAVLLIQTYRANTAEALAESRLETINGLNDRVRSDAALIDARDGLIKEQNAGIAALSAQRQETREVYIRQFAAADERASANDRRAEQIMALPADHLDELASCRASRILLEGELIR